MINSELAKWAQNRELKKAEWKWYREKWNPV
jgi:hypothetical protein